MSRSEGTQVRRGGHAGPPGTMPVEKAKDFRGTLTRLVRYLKPNRVKNYCRMCFGGVFHGVYDCRA